MRFFDSTAILDKSTILLCTIEDDHEVFSKGISLLSHPSLMQIQLYILTRSKTGSWKLEMSKSLATLSRAVCRLQLSHKQLSKTASERNELLRATWQAEYEYGDIPMEYFVWIDESSVDDKTNQCTDGWSPLGRTCVRRDTFIHMPLEVDNQDKVV
ncbi:hypothetical protein PAXRUDRAFT_681538 [Paxillus rubicundulus Ve08.2h10]|uniref:Uncharacterized protein n=1 Tax=Paxillus rubicundulus Ve08.2h10 TaxID=930991 RepID=A0A0D0E1J2_9AGAM|nr:hypothetical protein PAXRUDRAFT_681538 [Paxillus rubicundulus Ve08.2h10]